MCHHTLHFGVNNVQCLRLRVRAAHVHHIKNGHHAGLSIMLGISWIDPCVTDQSKSSQIYYLEWAHIE